ncbi:hypothetical protein DOTSEDRAFT_21195 [Dothistroma septosporum NZE10]|uniref:USP domain-containing protein n=1 Tax=Dothistroma septosporum (strain NZE10 / CBS 128990) TaxID=675120 RepID=N1PYC8_DOTSN|nr:hypothetical protein DOTSEDRAFT_21195 [Dothistroma septosporum NZE10]
MPRGTTFAQFIRADLVERHERRCESAQCEARYGKNKEPIAERTITNTWIPLQQVLIVRLGRLGWDRVAKEATKDRRLVPYPEQIDLGKFLNEGNEEHMYRLDGIVAHRGGTPKSGHYVAAARCPNGNVYCVLNDEMDVEYSLSFATMQDPIFSLKARFEPCVLVYSKI